MEFPVRRVVGLMSGTSLDGVDAALVETDGGAIIRPVGFHCRPYTDAERTLIRAAIADARAADAPCHTAATRAAAIALTAAHAEAVSALPGSTSAELIGFHGQTIVHRPERGWTWQIGDGAALATRLQRLVVADFRAADMAAGGQGAPLLPVFHRALAGDIRTDDQPIAILNLGGVGNITWLGPTLGAWLSFDTGPANALVDDWVRGNSGAAWDEGGRLAAGGRVDEARVAALMADPWFAIAPPKSLDRDRWSAATIARGLSPADGAATLTAVSAAAVARALTHLPRAPERVLVCGGGRLNATLMAALSVRLACPVAPVEAVGWNGDAIEAEAFAYFAVRRVTGRPITFPETTGCATPTVGGVVHLPVGA